MKGPTGLPGPTRFSQRSTTAAPDVPAPASTAETDAPATLPIARRDRVQALFDEEVTTLRDDSKTVVRRPDETTRPSAHRPAPPVEIVEPDEVQEAAEEEAVEDDPADPPAPPPRDLFSDLLEGGDDDEPLPESLPVPPSAEPTAPRYPLPASVASALAASDDDNPTTLPPMPRRMATMPPSSRADLFAQSAREIEPVAPVVPMTPGVPVEPLALAPPAPPAPQTEPLAPIEPTASVVVSESVLSEAPAPSLPPLVAAPVQAPVASPSDHDEREDEPRAKPLTFPFPLRKLIQSLKSGVGQRHVEEVSLALSDCVRTQHAQGQVFGERLIPENFTCTADRRVEFSESSEAQVRESVEVYLAPELIRAKAPSMQSDVFACAAVVYELLTGRTLKPMFMPKVLQTSRTDTWFVDPGASMHEQYKVILRKALADRPSERYTDAGAFSEDLVRAWRLIHNPPVRRVEVEKPRDDWSAIVKAILVAVLFILVLVGLLAFPTERHDAPPVRPVQPEITP
jgi:hypothetical protein